MTKETKNSIRLIPGRAGSSIDRMAIETPNQVASFLHGSLPFAGMNSSDASIARHAIHQADATREWGQLLDALTVFATKVADSHLVNEVKRCRLAEKKAETELKSLRGRVARLQEGTE